jgi:hypothetical protein
VVQVQSAAPAAMSDADHRVNKALPCSPSTTAEHAATMVTPADGVTEGWDSDPGEDESPEDKYIRVGCKLVPDWLVTVNADDNGSNSARQTWHVHDPYSTQVTARCCNVPASSAEGKAGSPVGAASYTC